MATYSNIDVSGESQSRKVEVSKVAFTGSASFKESVKLLNSHTVQLIVVIVISQAQDAEILLS